MKEIVCNNCGSINDYRPVPHYYGPGTGTAAVCNGCDNHIIRLGDTVKEVKATLTDNSIMAFGKHKGKALANVPAEYFLWLKDNAPNLQPELRQYISSNLDVFRQEVREAK